MIAFLVLSCLLMMVHLHYANVYIPQYNSTLEGWPGKVQRSLPCTLSSSSSHKVLVFVDSNFFDLFRNWYTYYHHSCGKQTNNRDLLLVCMDGKAHRLLKALRVPGGLQCDSTYDDVSTIKSYRDSATRIVKLMLSSLWMKRLAIINDLLGRGVDLILSDTDAFWLKNPYPELNQHVSSSHIVSSRGWFPFSISRIWGSTVCMGFMFVKADAFTKELFSKVLDKMVQKDLEVKAFKHYQETKSILFSDPAMNKTIIFDVQRWNRDECKTPDDQYAINQVLMDMGIRWPANMSKTLVSNSHTGELSWQGGTVNVTLLQELTFVRNCANNRMNQRFVRFRPPSKVLYSYIYKRMQDAIVAHCFLSPHATGDFEKKKHYLVYYSLWRLPYDAEESSAFVYKDFQKYSDRYDYNETDIGYVVKRWRPQTASTANAPLLTRQIGQRRPSTNQQLRQRKRRSIERV